MSIASDIREWLGTAFTGVGVLVSTATFWLLHGAKKDIGEIKEQTNSLVAKAEDRAAIIGTEKLEQTRAKEAEAVKLTLTLEPRDQPPKSSSPDHRETPPAAADTQKPKGKP